MAASFALLFAGALGFVGYGAGCGGTRTNGGFDPDGGLGEDDGGGFFGGPKDDAHVCVGRECDIAKCENGVKTTVTGTVYDPAGRNPIYNVIVYVPNGPVEPFKQGVSCDQCGVLTTGSPVVSTLTGPDGKFTLENVPTGSDIPLVMQIGKWRRQITIPKVESCTTLPLTDKTQTRLPKNKSEGDIPQIAITTGSCDPFECLLRNIGIDDAEFTDPTSNGRIHLYRGSGGSGISTSSPESRALWDTADATKMKTYDMIINSCECGEIPGNKPARALSNMVDYANSGGRMFATHYHYYWMDPTIVTTGANAPWKSTANFMREQTGAPTTATTQVDTSFPKGMAFAQWLVNVGASTTLGQLTVNDLRYNATTVNPPSTRWVSGTNGSSPALFHYTFNTPVSVPEAQQCGKVLFSDFHVAGTNPGGNFPQECRNNTMTAQQKALEFMLFDLSSCVTNDKAPPVPPK